MKKIYSFSTCLILALAIFAGPAGAQSITTTTTFLNNNGTGAVSFNLSNTNSSGVIITDIAGLTGTAGTDVVEFYYNPTPINGPLATLIPANGWNLIASGTITGIANTTTTATQPFFTGLNFLLPGNTTYGFVVYCTGQRYYTMPAASTISSGGVDFIATPTTAYGNGIPPAAPSIASRGWIGTITFMPALPCVAPPTPGTATSNSTNVCAGGQFVLNLSGNSSGSGQTYQWQTSTAAAGPYTNFGPSQNAASYTATATSTLYYRCALTCGTSTVYSTPVLVTVPALFPGGTYTINPALPATLPNFQTFTAAVNAISCGISGPVIFNVATGSGPYNEQISIPAINTTAVNTVTFNCNNVTLAYTNTTNAGNYAVLRLDGADYIKIKKLTVAPGAAGTYGYGICITNNADYNLIDSCTVDNGITGTSSTFAGIVLGGSATSATVGTTPCDSNIISNNTIIGGYYCTTMAGTAAGLQQYNQWINNVIRDYYFYGMYVIYNNNYQIINNDIHRTNRTNPSTFYGIVITTGNLKGNMSKNRLHNPFTGLPTSTSIGYFLYNGASATAGNENVWTNNIVYNMDGNGTHYSMYSVANSSQWYYNTISADYTAATAGITYGYYQSSTYTGITVKNNNISVTRGGTGAKYCVYHAGAGYTTVMNNNNYYASGATNYIGYNGILQATLANWQTASTQDAGSTSQNPNFVAPITGNLTPTNLAMDNIGVPIAGITTDITGFTRNTTTPDAGAFEFNNCTAPSGLAASGFTVSGANLSWNAVPASFGYEYVVDLLPGNPVGAGTATAATSYVASGLNSGTTYYLHVRNSCGTNIFSSWVTLAFTTCTQATITPLSSITFCTGGSVVLTANTGSTYQWKLNGNNITGATASSYTATGAGSYTVTVTTAATGCVSTSAAVNVQVTTPPSTITPSGSVTVCPGTTTALAGPSGTGLTYQWLLNGSAISGATGVTYNAGVAGNYTVTVSSGPGCFATTATPTIVSLYPATPAAITPPANPSVCPGGNVTLTANTGAGLTYQWQFNGVDIAGATTSPFTGPGIGNFTVKVTNTANGCTSTSAPQTITAAPVPPATMVPSAAASGCDSVVLIANAGAGYTYQWKLNSVNVVGANSIAYGAPQSGSYSVTVTNSFGCSATSSAVPITVNPSPQSQITYNSPLVFCEGSGVVLNTYLVNGYTYQWNMNGSPIPGANSTINMVTTSGNYAVQVTSNNGCSRVSAPVSVVVNPLPVPVITQTGNVLGTGSYAVYRWFYNNQAIPGAIGQYYNVVLNGAYRVDVTDTNGCKGSSAIYFMNSTGVNNLPGVAGDIRVYPNPSSGIIHIDAPVKVKLVVKDVSGKTMLSADNVKDIDLGRLADGMYLLYISNMEGQLLRAEKITKTAY